VPTAEHREPCESRGSRTDLGAPGGEIPPGDSTLADKPLRAKIHRCPLLSNSGQIVAVPRMSAKCQKQKSPRFCGMSALLPKASTIGSWRARLDSNQHPDRYERYCSSGEAENLTISIPYSHVYSCLLAAYRWSITLVGFLLIYDRK